MNITSIAPKLKGVVKVGKTFIMTNRPNILLGSAIVATVGGTVMAAKGGYEARGIVDEEQARRDAEEKSAPLTTKEKAQLTWQCYLPSAILTTTAIGSTCGLHLIHVKEKKALAQAGLAALEELKTLDVAKEVLETSDSVTVENSDGEVEELYLVRDGYSGRDIWSNQHRIESAVIELNNVLNGSGDCELNHFYSHAGFANLPGGSDVGWSGALVDLEWKETKRDDGRPVRVFTFRPSPSPGFDDAHR